ncbi:terminase [Staphylococcus condimenti]|uniref:phage tail protein n=1 Tax=Staphylococcus condimenti TaxID=70255 RepID=UPI0009474D06|nr:terminase [Staphylococcus condimenti]APR61418.1 terminase [Staphylococcus condimenti]
MEKNFYARINAIIKGFERGVRKAQRLAKTSVPNEIETEIKANTTKFQRALTRAKAMAQKWREHTVNLGMVTKEYTANLEKAKAQVERFRQHKVDLKLSNEELMIKYKTTKETVEAWRKHVVKLDLDASPAEMALNGFKEDLIELGKHHFDIDSGRWKLGNKFTKQFNHIEGQARTSFGKINKLMRKTWHDGGRALGDFSDKMDHLAGRIRSFGTVFGQQIKGVIVASFQALIPIIAGLVPVIMAVGNALKVVTGGAIALAGAVGIAAGGFVGFGAMAISAIKMLNDGTLQVTKETQAYQRALDGVKDTWSDIIKQNQAQIFNAMANGLNAIKVSLKGLTPFLSGVSNVMEKASQDMLKWAKSSKVAKKFFNEMGTTGVSIFADLVKASGQFGSGLISMFTQLMPLFKWSSQWLQRLGEDFNKWVNSAKGQNAIKQFMEYTKTNLPIIGNIFKNTFAGINNLLKAFGQNSTNIFKWLEQMTAKFREWSETVGKSEGFKKFVQYVEENGPVIMKLIGDIVRILVAFGTAMAPIASALLKLIGAVASFTASLLESHPNVARFFGILTILAGAFWALLAPIMFISSVLTNVFGVTLLQALGHIVKFMKTSSLLKGILNIVKGAFSLLLSPIGNLTRLLPILSTAFSALTGPIGIIIGVIVALIGIIVWLWKTNEGFRNMIIGAWNGIKEAIGNAIQGIIDWFMQLWQNIQQTLQPIIPLLQLVGNFIMQVLGGIVYAAIMGVIFAFQSLWNAVSIIFTAIGGIISVVVQIIVGLFTILIQLLTGDFSGAWITLQTTISNVMNTIWSTLVSIWNTISQFIFNTLNRILGTNITSWAQVWETIKSAMTGVMSTVSSGFSNVVSTVISKMGQALASIISNAAQWVASIISAMTQFVQGIVSGFVNVVSNVKSGMENALSTIRNFFSSFSNVGGYLMEGLAQGIANGASSVINAAKGVAEAAIGAAKRALGVHSPSRVFRSIGQYVSQGLGIGIANHAYKAVDAVKSISNQMMNAFDADLEPSFDVGGLGASIAGQVDGFITDDVRHSIQENSRPIVNIEVRNEGDLEYIRSVIKDMDAKDYYT